MVSGITTLQMKTKKQLITEENLMNKITQSLTLDLVEIRHNIVNARQGDKLVRDLTITITNNGCTYPLPEHADVRLRGTRPDGNYVFYDGTATVSDRANGIVHVQIPDYLLSSSGRAYLDIGIYQDAGENKTEIASTEKFVLYIPEHTFSEEDAVHSPEGSTLSNLIQTTRELEKTVSENEEARQTGYSGMTNKISQVQSLVSAGKPVWDDKYTRNEVDNKFSSLETNIDWKESVETFDDIAAAYPDPQDGWTVNVKDTDYTYRYNGTEWVTISANAIPKATAAVDGLLSKEDKAGYDDANAKKHIHDNKEALDTVTSEQISKWNSLDSDMTGSTSDTEGVHGLVPAPPTSSVSLFLKNDGSWGIPDSSPQTKIDSIILEELPLTQEVLLSQNASITKTKEIELAPETEYTLFFAGAKVSSLRGFTQWKYEINIAVMETGSGETVVIQNLDSISENGIRTAASKKSAERLISTEGILKPKLKITYKWYREYPKTAIPDSSYVKNDVTVKGLGNSFAWNANTLSIDQGFQLDITGLEWNHLSLAFSSSDPDSLDGILYPYLLTNNGGTSNYKHGFEVSKSGNLITIYYRGFPLSATSSSEFKFFFDDSYNTVVASVASPSYSATTSPYHLSLKYETTVGFSGSYNDLADKPEIPAAVRIKGNEENTYHTGDVNLTSESIGAVKRYNAFFWTEENGSASGWYRICSFTPKNAIQFTLNASRAWYNNAEEVFSLKISVLSGQGTNRVEFEQLGAMWRDHLLTKVRVTYASEGSPSYLEIYYDGNYKNRVTFDIYNITNSTITDGDMLNISSPISKSSYSGTTWEYNITKEGLIAKDAVGVLKTSGGTMTGGVKAVGGKNSDSYSSTALDMSNSNITNVNGIYTADNADNGSEGINFYRSATTVDSLHASAGNLYFTPNRTLGTNGTSYKVSSRIYGTINPVHGSKNSASYVYKDTDNHGHLHLYITGVTLNAGAWTTVASSTIKPPLVNRGHVIVADGAYTLSGAERTGCTFNNAGEVSIISPISFSGKDVYIDVFW